MIEIVSREQIETSPTIWMVAADMSGLGLTDCGCGKSQDRRVVQSRGPNVLEVVFYHDNGERCMMAFLRPDFAPLTYENYLAEFPAIEGDEVGIDGDGTTVRR